MLAWLSVWNEVLTHMAQLMPLPLTVSCSSKIQTGFAFLVPARPGSPGQGAVKRVCVCVCEHLIHAGPHLIVHLSLLFNSMIHHCMVPSDFCNGIILPLLKNKHGDATDVNMYRGITISPVISNLFESILFRLHDSFLTSDSLQYGFKKNSYSRIVYCERICEIFH